MFSHLFLHVRTYHTLYIYQCDASEATWQLIQVVLDDNGTQPDPRIMFLGGGCSPATEPLAALSGRFYNVTQVSNHLHLIPSTVVCRLVHRIVKFWALNISSTVHIVKLLVISRFTGIPCLVYSYTNVHVSWDSDSTSCIIRTYTLK